MTDEITPATAVPNSPTVPLEEGIVRGDTTITSIILRRPKAGELRGLKLKDLLESDVASVITLLPRISDPTLTASEIESMAPRDFAELSGTIFGFFMTAAEYTAAKDMMSTS